MENTLLDNTIYASFLYFVSITFSGCKQRVIYLVGTGRDTYIYPSNKCIEMNNADPITQIA